MPKEIISKEIISKEREEVIRGRLETVIESLQTLSQSERLRVLNTVIVFFGLEEEI